MAVQLRRSPVRRRRLVLVVGSRPPLGRTVGLTCAGAGAGAVVAYLFDPDRGRTRRALLRNKVVHATRRTRGGLEALADDLGNRSRGALSGVRSRIGGEPVDDRVLHERVRAELGRRVGNPHAIRAHVENGVVTLTGDVLAGEARRARRAARRVPGVTRVEARWTVHRDPTGVPALQGTGEGGPAPGLSRQHWSPSTRALAGTASAALWGLSARLPRPLAWALRVAGAGLAVRAVTDLPAKRLTGVGAGRRSIDVEDTITVTESPDRVWPLLSDYTAFPRIMPDVREVRRFADGSSYWVISGPAGVPVTFQAEETDRVEGRAIAWKTRAGQLVAHRGRLRLDPEGDGRARVEVQLTYNPVAGAIGHAVARLFRADPRHKLHGDLQRLKAFLETGRPPHDAARPVR